MGGGFRVFDVRLDQVAHLGFTLVGILIFAVGIATLVSSRTKAGRASLMSAMGLFIFAHLISVCIILSAMTPNPIPGQWITLLSLAGRFVNIGGVSFLIIGLRDLLQRNDLLETLQDEALDDQD